MLTGLKNSAQSFSDDIWPDSFIVTNEAIIEELKTDKFKKAMNFDDQTSIEKFYQFLINVQPPLHPPPRKKEQTSPKKSFNLPPILSQQMQQLKNEAERGDVNSMQKFAESLFKDNGIHFIYGIQVNKLEAAKYYKIASDKGNPFSMNNLAVMLYTGSDIEMNKCKAALYILHCSTMLTSWLVEMV